MPSWTAQLNVLRQEWPTTTTDQWHPNVRRSKAQSVYALSLPATFGVEQIADIDHTASFDPRVAEALERFAPNFDPDVIADFDVEALRGLEGALRGALFEILVAEKAENGNLELPLEAHELTLADDFSTPGFDAILRSNDGDILGVAQLKTSSSADIIQEHLQRYPEIDVVVASSEAASDALTRGITSVVDSGISDNELKSMVTELISAYSRQGTADLKDGLIAEFAYLAIAVQFVLRFARGSDLKDSLKQARSDAILVSVLSIFATGASVLLGTELARIPVVITFGTAKYLFSEVDRSTHNVLRIGQAARSIEADFNARIA